MKHCLIYLPSNTRIEYVGPVIGKLLGCKVDGTRRLIKGVFYKKEEPHKVRIVIRPKPKVMYDFCYNYEAEVYSAYRLISAICNPFHLALGDRLIKFFGGMIFYDQTLVETRRANLHVLTKEDSENKPTLTDDFNRLQDRIFRLEPLTSDEVKEFRLIALEKTHGARLHA